MRKLSPRKQGPVPVRANQRAADEATTGEPARGDFDEAAAAAL